MLIGGQALAFWLAWFRIDVSDGPRPYVSSDADFLGMREHVETFARAIRGTAIYPPKRGLTALHGAVRKRSAGGREVGVDVLHKIVGLESDAVRRRALEVTHPNDPALRFLVMEPVDCLASRLENLRQLTGRQTDVGVWQTVKAVAICRAYITRLVRDAGERKAIKVATALFRLAGSAAGLQAHERYGVDILDGVPLDQFSNASFLGQQARRAIMAIETLRAKGKPTRGAS